MINIALDEQAPYRFVTTIRALAFTKEIYDRETNTWKSGIVLKIEGKLVYSIKIPRSSEEAWVKLWDNKFTLPMNLNTRIEVISD